MRQAEQFPDKSLARRSFESAAEGYDKAADSKLRRASDLSGNCSACRIVRPPFVLQ